MPNILITGGAGFIGSNLANFLSNSPRNQITIVDNLSTGSKSYVPKKSNTKFIKTDVNDAEQISKTLTERTFDYVYHYAAVVGVQRTLQNPIAVLRDIDGIKNILEICKAHKAKRIFFASSSEVYGEPVEMPQHEETTPLNSRLPYAVVKNVGESFLRSYKQEYGLDYTIFRFFNTYGPRQSTDFVVSKFLDAALKGKDITIYGRGRQTRTFCYIDDNVEASIRAINDKTTLNQVINIGNDKEISVINLAKEALKITGSKSKIIYLPALEEGDMTRRKPDASKMRRLLGRKYTSMDEGIRRLIKYWNISA